MFAIGSLDGDEGASFSMMGNRTAGNIRTYKIIKINWTGNHERDASLFST